MSCVTPSERPLNPPLERISNPGPSPLVTDPDLKKQIRKEAEREERAFYEGRASQKWLDDLRPFGTTWSKPFLEHAPALVIAFAQTQALDGSKHYYVKESVGMAVGVLIATLHLSGLATLTHTPSPMGFLSDVLDRPKNERAFILLPVGYPEEPCFVPDLTRLPLDEVLVEY